MGSHHAQPKLGELLVDTGALDDDALEDALLEQQVSRKRLGAILVGNGVISPPDLTAALKTQLGDEPAAYSALGRPADAAATGKPRRGLFRRRRAASEPQAETVSEQPESPDGPGSDAEAVNLALLRDLQSIMRRHLDALRADFEQAGKDLEASRFEILARNERIAELETQLATSERERRQLVEALQVELTRSRTALHRYRAEAPVLPSPPTAIEQPASPPADANYLLLVPDGAGSHALRTSAGQPPAVGSQIAIAGQSFVAVSHRRSPIDADERVCVQLEPR
jgi:hypothetical protein